MRFPIANIVWKAENFEVNYKQTQEVIEHFRHQISHYEPQFGRVRTGFMARPFGSEFDGAERFMAKYFGKQGIKLQTYNHPPGVGPMLTEMERQVRECHFAVVDLTGLNANVIHELGMIKILGKPVIMLRHHGDEAGMLPSNLSGQYCYEYKCDAEGRLEKWDYASSRFEAIDDVLVQFVRDLEKDPQFVEARPHQGV